MKTANLLVGNPEDTPVLECTLLGPELEFQSDGLIAVSGAHMPPIIDGETMPLNTSLSIRAGQRLRFGYPLKGHALISPLRGDSMCLPRSTVVLRMRWVHSGACMAVRCKKTMCCR
ncbi:hypothetical protein P4S72_25355 [Vibrio sp. PP-XX7]